MPQLGSSWVGERAVLVPVKRFADAKTRLASALSPSQRAELAAAMARRVIASAGELPVAVVCDDREVAAFARQQSALVLWEPGLGLNGAVAEGVRLLGKAGARLVVVAAGDLPLAEDLTWVTRFDGITIVPDRRHEGTNVLGIPTDRPFEPSYGPGSFARHLDQARALAVPVRVVNAPQLAWDVDFPADLAALQG